MKRKIATIITSLTLVVVLLVTLCACGSTWGSIKSAYEKEGYHELTLSDKVKEKLGLTDEQTKEADATVHFLCTATLSEDPTITELAGLLTAKTAIVWEYKNVDALKKAYQEDLSESQQEKFDELWDEYQKSDRVNGNCILIVGDAKIFKGTK